VFYVDRSHFSSFNANLFIDIGQYGFLRQISADPNNTVIVLVRDKPATDTRISAEMSDRKNISVIQGDLTDIQSLKVITTSCKINRKIRLTP
jgi:hypothetical protein